MIASDWSRAHAGKWTEAIGRIGHSCIAWQVKPHDLGSWIERRLRSRGVKATPDAVARLVQRIEGNLLAAAQEIDKLALLVQGEGGALECAMCAETRGLIEEVAALSGGQQRRVLIARALAGRPDMLVMDEPTAGVDHANQEALALVLQRLADRGTSMLVVTHELEALEPVVTRVVVIDRGGITFDGPTAQFEQVHPHVHHDHDTHHHDLELSAQASPGVVTSGPFHEPGGVRGG